MSVTEVPLAYCAEQAAPQLTPPGLLCTYPLPVIPTVRVYVVPAVKVAVTDISALSVTLQLATPPQAPLQPVKTEFGAGMAVRVTTVPL